MKQGTYRFHCTDGWALIADMRGTYVRSGGDLAAKARRHLGGLMAAMPDGLDWSGWIVDVHDARGRHVMYVEPGVEWSGVVPLVSRCAAAGRADGARLVQKAG